MSLSAKVYASTSTGTSKYSHSHVSQSVIYTSTQGTKMRPHPPATIYENPHPPQLLEGLQFLGSQSWSQAAEKFLEAVNYFPTSINSKHLAGIAFHQMGLNQPVVYGKMTVKGCCCSSSEVSFPDTYTTEKNRLENYNKAKGLLNDAYLQSTQLPNNIRSQIAFSYAMVIQSIGDDDLKRALITRAVELDRDNLEALAVKEGQDRPEFNTHVNVQAHAVSSATASASASSSSTFNR
mmetsp:Transcript_8910/g.9420  ORF Transcript_8910/g.9420 Transcript_8910/m.9420 type:complete len:236 (-) Transcript_8910:161-868(-)